VALAAMVLYPKLDDPETGYIRVMIDVLPAGWRGLMLAAFAAAYMSTIATHLNWGTSYLVNDFYRRFVRPEADERHYVLVSRLATVVVMLLAALATSQLDSIRGAWQLLLAIGAGTGPVYLLRWYWWRINAWSEIAAQLAALGSFLLTSTVLKLNPDQPDQFALSLVISVAITTSAWLAVTFLTPPESAPVLERFYRTVRPEGTLWAPVAARLGLRPGAGSLPLTALHWLAGVLLVYGALFGIGKLLFKEWLAGGLFLFAAAVAGFVLVRTFQGFAVETPPLREPVGEE